MLIHTLIQYLESHRRLVVPQLGTFIVKEPGRSVVFSELLKRDDGVLRGLLRAEGMGELEAAGEIDRFVFEIRHAVEHGSEYRLEGFGVMKPGPNATIAFVYEPQPASESPAQEPAARETSAAATREGGRGRQDGFHGAARVDFGEDESRSFGAGAALWQAAEEHRCLPLRRPRAAPPRRPVHLDRRDRRLLAVAAIAFGLWRDAREKQAENEYIELPQAAELPSAASQPEQLK